MTAPILPRGPRNSDPETAVALRGHAWLDAQWQLAVELDEDREVHDRAPVPPVRASRLGDKA